MAATVSTSVWVSVIIPAFNSAEYIAPALESALAQSFRNYEIVLVNDGSPDTERFEKTIQPYRSRITYLTQENRGPAAARNTGIRHAHGEWIAFLDSDDAWLPHYLEKQLQVLHNDFSLDMVYCDALLEGGSTPKGRTFMDLCPSIGPVTFESVLVEQTQVLTSATVVRREKIVAAGLFDERLRCAEDHDLWLRLLHGGGKAAYHREPLVRRRLRPDSQGSAPGALLAGEIQSLKKLERELNLSPATRDLLLKRLVKIEAAHAFVQGKALLLAGASDRAYDSLHRAYALAPSAKLRAMLLGLRIAPGFTVKSARFWRRRTPALRQA